MTPEYVALLIWSGVVVTSLLMSLMVAIQVQIERDVATVKRLNREWEADAQRFVDDVRIPVAPPAPDREDGI